MFASSHSSAYICLRCQSHSISRRAIAAATFQHARFFSQSRRLLEQAAQSPAQEVGNKRKKPKSSRQIYPHGKLRGKKGGEVRESIETLPQEALGKPAEIILLKDADLDQSKSENGYGDSEDPPSLDAPEPQRKSSKKAILEAAENGSVNVDAASTFQSIEELRDTIIKRKLEKGDLITQDQHDDLVKALAEGFRSTQLKDYAGRKNILTRRVKQTAKLPHSDWTPGVSESNERHLILTANMNKRHIPKTKLAKTIVERAWQLHVETDTLKVGEVDVYDAQSFVDARDEYGTLLLDQIAKARHVKMELLTEKVLRITGDKERAMSALGDISEVCLSVLHDSLRSFPLGAPDRPRQKQPAATKSARGSSKNASQSPPDDPTNPEASLHTPEGTLKSSIDEFLESLLGSAPEGSVTESLKDPRPHTAAIGVSLTARKGISQPDIEMLRSTTGVMPRLSLSRNELVHNPKASDFQQLTIHGHSKDQMADSMRAVFAMADLATRSEHSFHSINTQKSRVAGPMPLHFRLPCHERSEERRRLVSVQSKKIRDPKPVHADTITNLLNQAKVGSASAKKDALKLAETSDIWQSTQSPSLTSLTTRLGFIYYHHEDRSKSLFTPGLAHLSPLLSFLSTSSTALRDTRSVISFTFRHDPPHGDTDARLSNKAMKQLASQATWLKNPLPEVRFDFCLPVQPGGTPTLAGVRVLIMDRQYHVDVRDKPIDFSVGESCILEADMQNPSTSYVFQPAIKEMEASIAGQSRLRAPPVLHVPIPQSWITTKGKPKLGPWDSEPFKTDHVKARYRFVGVQLKQILGFEREGRTMEITTVEGGRLGARYTELSVKIGDEEAQREDRVKTAFEVGVEMVGLVDRAARGNLEFDNKKGGRDDEDGMLEFKAGGIGLRSFTEPDQQVPDEVLEPVDEQRVAASG